MLRLGKPLFRLLGPRSSRPAAATCVPPWARWLHSSAIPPSMWVSPSLTVFIKPYHIATHPPSRSLTRCATRPSRSHGSTQTKPRIRLITDLAYRRTPCLRRVNGADFLALTSHLGVDGEAR